MNRDNSGHLIAGFAMGLFALLAATAPEVYERLAQEDAWIEWLTVGLFCTAGMVFLSAAKRHGFATAWVITATGLFCIVVAGEEISWGQRLLGFTPPESFLESNYQQELNLHNFSKALFEPKWLVIATLSVWGVSLPVFYRLNASLPLPKHLETILLPISYIPWSVCAIVLLLIYPIDLTAEYVELFTGLLFYLTAFPSDASLRPKLVYALLPFLIMGAGFGGIEMSARVDSAEKIACAQKEVGALTKAIYEGGADDQLLERSYVHKRIFTAIQANYLTPDVIEALRAVGCVGVSQNPNRRKYAMDPWGQPYWMQYEEPEEEEVTIAVYSFGPNRRRDFTARDFTGTDDIGAFTRPLKVELVLE